jgi:hypothetical protein
MQSIRKGNYAIKYVLVDDIPKVMKQFVIGYCPGHLARYLANRLVLVVVTMTLVLVMTALKTVLDVVIAIQPV